MVTVMFKPGHRHTLAQATGDASSVVGSSADCSKQSSDALIVEKYIVEKDLHWGLRDLTSQDNRGPSILRRIQEHCRT